VVAGAPVARARRRHLAHIGLNLGTLALVANFLLNAARLFAVRGSAGRRRRHDGDRRRWRSHARGTASAITGLRLAFGSAVTLVLGALLVFAARCTHLELVPLLAAHVAWGFSGDSRPGGGRGYQVVPMFQVTPAATGPAAAAGAVHDARAALARERLGDTGRRRAARQPARAGGDQLRRATVVATASAPAHRRSRCSSGSWPCCASSASRCWVPRARGLPAGFRPAPPLVLGTLAVRLRGRSRQRHALQIVPFSSGSTPRRAPATSRYAAQDIVTPAAAWHLRLHLMSFVLLAGALFWPVGLSRPAGLLWMATGAWLARNLYGAARSLPPMTATTPQR
jgi:hypothetical protein